LFEIEYGETFAWAFIAGVIAFALGQKRGAAYGVAAAGLAALLTKVALLELP